MLPPGQLSFLVRFTLFLYDDWNLYQIIQITLLWLLYILVPQLDIRDPEAVKAAVDKIEQELGLPSVVNAHHITTDLFENIVEKFPSCRTWHRFHSSDENVCLGCEQCSRKLYIPNGASLG